MQTTTTDFRKGDWVVCKPSSGLNILQMQFEGQFDSTSLRFPTDDDWKKIEVTVFHGGKLAFRGKSADYLEIMDYECYPDIHSHQRYNEKTCRWYYVFPFWIEYGTHHRLECDFADVCQWAYERNLIEDYCIETKEGQVTIPGTSDVQWSVEKQDAVETFTGRYLMNFTDFLREYLTEKDLIEFIKHQTGKVKHT